MTNEEKRKMIKLYIAAKGKYVYWKDCHSYYERQAAENAKKNFIRITKICELLNLELPILTDEQVLSIYDRWLESELDSWYDKQWRRIYMVLL